ncbi:MAG: ABC transporter ATP-binding protein [Nonomuraea sp.]|nr:ABC transporter ATP-binding protein [Nonomuraea sp.]
MTAIQIDGLSRDYRGRGGAVVHALRGIDLDVPAGQVFGLLGPNGAGKTTLARILATLLTPTSGTARVLGHDVDRDTVAVRRLVGCVFGGDSGLYERLSGRDNLRYFAELYGVRARHARIDELLDLVGLTAKAGARVETYSRGMRQRLHLARGLIHDPAVLLLDEPTIGIDPVGARQLRSLVNDLRARGKTILLTTHYMYEADELCDDIAVIVHGRIAARGTAASLKSLVEDTRVIELELRGAGPDVLDDLRRVPGVRSLTVEEQGQAQQVRVQADGDEELTGALLKALRDTPLGRVVTREPTLEDAYVRLVEEQAEGRADG